MVGEDIADTRVPFGQLCAVHVTRFEVLGASDDVMGRHALIEFLVRAHKTKAVCRYEVKIAYDGMSGPMSVSQKAWEDLTGLGQTDAGHFDRDVSPSQQAIIDDLKRFVCTETAKDAMRLPLDVV
jgi:hypothetical protein